MSTLRLLSFLISISKVRSRTGLRRRSSLVMSVCFCPFAVITAIVVSLSSLNSIFTMSFQFQGRKMRPCVLVMVCWNVSAKMNEEAMWSTWDWSLSFVRVRSLVHLFLLNVKVLLQKCVKRGELMDEIDRERSKTWTRKGSRTVEEIARNSCHWSVL